MSARWTTLDGRPTRVIAHRGASGELPEHTLAAYARALEQGADWIEPDLVMTRDAQLVARHDRGLARSTDVAAHPPLASRVHQGDWAVDGFTLDELGLLRARQPLATRDRSHDARYPIPSFASVLDWASAQGVRRGVPVTLYPELKHPSAFAAAGLDPVPAFLAATAHCDPAHVRLWLQCFEPGPLRRVREARGLPVVLLLEADADWRAALAAHGAWLSGLAVSKALLQDPALVPQAHAAGLEVHAWTYRDDHPGPGGVEAELRAAFDLGVDAVFSDYPATALACRARRAQAGDGAVDGEVG